MNNNLVIIGNNAVVYFNTITIFRNEESFLNSIYNNIQFIIFVLAFFFYWSCQAIYNQNKKIVKEHYPNVAV
jgi:hypothetical protein